MQPNVMNDFRSHLGQAAVSAAKVMSCQLNSLNIVNIFSKL